MFMFFFVLEFSLFSHFDLEIGLGHVASITHFREGATDLSLFLERSNEEV